MCFHRTKTNDSFTSLPCVDIQFNMRSSCAPTNRRHSFVDRVRAQSAKKLHDLCASSAHLRADSHADRVVWVLVIELVLSLSLSLALTPFFF